MNAPIIELADIRKTYYEGTAVATEVLHGVNLTVRAGE